VTPVFDIEAEKEMLESISEEIDNAISNVDLATLQRYFHEDLKNSIPLQTNKGWLIANRCLTVWYRGRAVPLSTKNG
jgi:hypothetical protein